MTRMDSTRLGKNFAYMIRTLKKIPKDDQRDEKFLAAGKAVLEHHVDNQVRHRDVAISRTEDS
jgi:hypothetical protein